MKIGRQSFFTKIMAMLTVVLVLLGAAITLQTRIIMNNLFSEQQQGISGLGLTVN